MGDLIASGVIPCQIASKSNSRRWTGKMSIKSKPAMAFVEAASLAIPQMETLYEGLVTVTATCYYRSRRPDLDAELLMDCLQGRVIQNDRQIWCKHLFRGLDKDNPRVEWTVTMGVDDAGLPTAHHQLN